MLISDLLMDGGKRLNTAKVIQFKKTDSYQELIKCTSFLTESTTFAERLYCYINSITSFNPCIVCGSPTKFGPTFKDGYMKTCSFKCSSTLIDQKEKYKKFKNSITNHVRHPIIPKDEICRILDQNRNLITARTNFSELKSKFPGIIESVKQYSPLGSTTSRMFYLIDDHSCEVCGSDTFFQGKEKGFSKRCRKHSSSSSTRKSNSISSAIEKLSSHYNILQTPDGLNGGSFLLECNRGHQFEKYLHNGAMGKDVSKLCPRCFPRTISSGEYEICDWLDSLNIPYLQQYHIPNTRKTIDIYIPSRHIGIEYDGLMFHSFGKSYHDMFDNMDAEKRQKYDHLWKTNQCELNGIQLFHIFSNEWDSNKDLWKSLLMSKLGVIRNKIYARKCEVVELCNSEYESFTRNNHLQGYAVASIRLALKYGNEVTAVAGFSKSRFSKNLGDYELIRYCNFKNSVVVGGFSKLISAFSKTHPGCLLISYANKRWSRGSVYEKNGFDLIRTSKPNYFYFKEGSNDLENRTSYQRHKLNDNSEQTESEIMFERGYRRIWDCGNMVYLIKT